MTLAHDVAGSGPTVVLLPMGDRRMWDRQLPVLIEAGYQVIRCDLRGNGQSPAATEPFTPAEDVRELFDVLGIRDAAVIGASYGGRLAQEVAARWPDRVRSLMLLCSSTRLHRPTESVMAFSRREAELFAQGDLDALAELSVATYLGPAASAGARVALADMVRRSAGMQLTAGDSPNPRDSIFARNADFDLSAITARTMVVSGRHDLDYFRTTADHLATSIPGAVRVELPWAGHLPAMEDPDAAGQLIAGWLAAGA